MKRYWRLPLWIPIGLRNFILGFEPHDHFDFVRNCTRIGMHRTGAWYMPGDWKLIAAEIHLTAGKIGVSPYWLAEMWADPQAYADWNDEGVWHK